jgi:hypothetical protein
MQLQSYFFYSYVLRTLRSYPLWQIQVWYLLASPLDTHSVIHVYTFFYKKHILVYGWILTNLVSEH